VAYTTLAQTAAPNSTLASQNVQADAAGHYAALLGSASADGVRVESV
jgi:hypothetical protein